jgi:hypothetical protein
MSKTPDVKVRAPGFIAPLPTTLKELVLETVRLFAPIAKMSRALFPSSPMLSPEAPETTMFPAAVPVLAPEP